MNDVNHNIKQNISYLSGQAIFRQVRIESLLTDITTALNKNYTAELASLYDEREFEKHVKGIESSIFNSLFIDEEITLVEGLDLYYKDALQNVIDSINKNIKYRYLLQSPEFYKIISIGLGLLLIQLYVPGISPSVRYGVLASATAIIIKLFLDDIIAGRKTRYIKGKITQQLESTLNTFQ